MCTVWILGAGSVWGWWNECNGTLVIFGERELSLADDQRDVFALAKLRTTKELKHVLGELPSPDFR